MTTLIKKQWPKNRPHIFEGDIFNRMFDFIDDGSIHNAWSSDPCNVYTTKELRIPTVKTKRNHKPIPENTVRLFSTQPSGAAKTTGTPSTKTKDTTIKANKAN